MECLMICNTKSMQSCCCSLRQYYLMSTEIATRRISVGKLAAITQIWASSHEMPAHLLLPIFKEESGGGPCVNQHSITLHSWTKSRLDLMFGGESILYYSWTAAKHFYYRNLKLLLSTTANTCCYWKMANVISVHKPPSYMAKIRM